MPKLGSRRRQPKSSAELSALAAAVLALAIAAGKPASAESLRRPFVIVGDAIPEPLVGAGGDAARGRAIVVDRQRGLCLLCHSGPFPDQPFQGNLAPSLQGAGTRWTAGQLRLRLVDGRQLNPATIMPSYYRVDGLTRVGSAWQGKPVLSAEQIEDVIAFLMTLTETP
jgi:sulfur-oxidizing protein SoxX